MDACSLAGNNSITLRVEPCWAAERFELEGFSLSDTIPHVLAEIVKKIKEKGLPCPQPEGKLRLKSIFGQSLEPDTTLEDMEKTGCLESNTALVLVFRPLLDLNDEPLDIPQRKDAIMFVEPSSSEEEDSEDDESNDEDHRCPVYYKGKMAEEPEFSVSLDLGINGDFQLLDVDQKQISVSHVWNVGYVVTTATAVLLAPSDHILDQLCALNGKEKKYVVLRVDIDLLSYVFLRFLRECFREMPIVAVTDLNPAHLDIIAFLDSDVGHVRRLYNLDLMNNQLSAREFSHFPHVNIRWLGLRYVHRGKLLPEAEFDKLAYRRPKNFDELMRRLLKNPNVSLRNSWFLELWHLKKDPRPKAFPPCGYALIPSMISNEEWA